MDPAFEGVGQEAGLKIWRIENFEVIQYPDNKYGKFHSGDSYIVLHTKKVNNALSWDIHFWLGTDTSQDEAGTAAIKSVELDDQLGGVPVQHREVQEHESKLFLSYFKAGITYLPGGVKSGFTHVDPDAYEDRLFQVKGRRNVRVRQVAFNISAMNKGDCFILDTNRDIYIYTGPQSRRVERLKAITAANKIRDQDHSGKAKVHILDESCDSSEIAKFFEILGSGSPGDVPEAGDDQDDVEHEKTSQSVVTLYKVSDADGSLGCDQVGVKPLSQQMLDSTDCFILDTAGSGLYVWIGRQSNKQEKIHSMDMATKFLEEKGYPKWTKVMRIVDGGEPSTFKQYFSSWKEPEEQKGLGRRYTENQIAASIPEKDFDVRSLHRKKRLMLAKNAGKAYGFMPDDGTGKLEIWRIENMELAPIPSENYGMFFGGDSYVLKYTYVVNGLEKYIIYFWQGCASSQDEKAASAIHAVRLDDELGGKPVQVRVTHGSEPNHFLKVFKGKMVIFLGGHASGFKNMHDHDTYDTDGTRLFRVRGTCEDDVRAEQMPEVASSLDSDDVFVLETPSNTFVWYGAGDGEGCSDEEKAMGQNVVKIVSPGREPVVINEGEEPDEFWGALGGKGGYTQMNIGLPDNPFLDPRLFQISIPEATGKLRVEEIVNFQQDDLITDDVMMMDTGAELYVWIGSGATAEEKKQGMTLATDYLNTEPSDRNTLNTVIFNIKQGEEPEDFKALFPSWDRDMWQG